MVVPICSIIAQCPTLRSVEELILTNDDMTPAATECYYPLIVVIHLCNDTKESLHYYSLYQPMIAWLCLLFRLASFISKKKQFQQSLPTIQSLIQQQMQLIKNLNNSVLSAYHPLNRGIDKENR